MSGMDIAAIVTFLSGLGKTADAANSASQDSQSLATLLLQYVHGATATDPYAFDGIVATLMANWSGDAANAFQAQTQKVRAFGVGLATAADMTSQPVTTGQQQQYDAGYLSDYTGASSALNLIFSDIYEKYRKVSDSATSYKNWPGYLVTFIRNVTGHSLTPGTGVTVKVPTVAEFAEGGQVSTSWVSRGRGGEVMEYNASTPGLTGELSLSTTQPFIGPGTTRITYVNPATGGGFYVDFEWNGWWFQDDTWNSKLEGYMRQEAQDEYHQYLGKLMNDLGDQYAQVRTPSPQDNSVLPKTNGSTSTQPNPGSYGGSYPGGVGGLGAGTTLGGATNGNVPGYGSGSANGGSSSPGSYGGDAYVPAGVNGGAVPGSYGGDGYIPGGYNAAPNAGGWNPTQLAGYNPNAGGGLGPGVSGLADGGPGALAGAGAGGAAGPGAAGGLTGAQAGAAGAAGTASRSMPMAPMSGMGGGKDGKERQRAAWLTEEEDVWGAAGEGGDAVL
jgi:hypothetical protein